MLCIAEKWVPKSWVNIGQETREPQTNSKFHGIPVAINHEPQTLLNSTPKT